MISALSYIVWSPDVYAFHLGSFAIRWYSLCWLIGLLGSYLMTQWLYKDQKIPQEKFEPLFVYCFVGILIGGRLGHCLFYEPDYFLSSWRHFVEMILPIHFLQDGGWKFTGYEGLASHGGVIGLLIAIPLYARHMKVPLWTVFDNIALACPITACLIRFGNLMNSEIIGKVTDVPWAIIFARVDMFPRHPGQLYESVAYFLFFFLELYIYRVRKVEVGRGFYFGLCLFFIFTFRFFIEYTKINQVDFEYDMLFNMGQLLSLPLALVGLWCMIRKKK